MFQRLNMLLVVMLLSSIAALAQTQISFTKSTNQATFTGAGQAIGYTFTVTNNSGRAIFLNSIVDNNPNVTINNCPSQSIADGASVQCSGTYTTTAADVATGTFVNTATATVDTCEDGCIETFTNDATISFQPQPTGDIVIRKLTVGGDGSFEFQSSNPALGSFNLRTRNGVAEKVASSLPAGTYAISEANAKGWKLTALSCTGGSFVTDLKTRTATINLTGGNSMVCTFTNTEFERRTKTIIANFMARRGDLLTSDTGRPRLVERLRHSNPESLKDGPMKLGGGGTDGAGRFEFATSLGQLRAHAQAKRKAEAAKLGGPEEARAVQLLDSRQPRAGLDVWVEGKFAYFNTGEGNSKSSGHFGLFRIGADYLVRPWLLFGALVQYDHLDESSQGLGYKIKGSGWMTGPYAEYRISENLIFDAKALWGTSRNDVNPYLAYEDKFKTERWLLSARLTGTWVSGRWHFSPRGQIVWYEDDAEGYTDGNGVFISGQKLSFGRVIVGPEVSYRYQAQNGGLIEPRLAIKGLWTFAQSSLGKGPNNGSVAYRPIDDFRMRLEGGLKLENLQGARLEFTGAYEGFGGSETEVTSGTIHFTMPFTTE